MAKPTFRATPMEIHVPATSANLGPGFDCLALALGIYDRFVAQVTDEPGLDMDIAGEGSEIIRRDEKNLLIKAMYQGFDFMGGRPRGLAVRALNVIPQSRGLGSSASVIVGGLLLARALVLSGEDRLSDLELLNLAAKLEGHPDNVSATLLGGATIAWMEEVNGHQVARAVGIAVDPRIRAVAFIPDSALSTAKARKLLPDSIPHAEAVANSTRSALLVQALSLQPELLFTATQDFLHQKYRQSAMPKSFALVENLRKIGVAAFISGAGPTVLVLHTGSAGITAGMTAEMRTIAGANFQMQEVEISPKGATLHTS